MANYQNDKPAAADQLNQSQADIQQNFLAIDDLINVDHEDFAGGAGDEGKHKQVTFTLSADDPATLANEMAIYNKGNALFVQPQNQVAGTDGVDFTTATAAPAVTGTCTLPSGITMKWGLGTATGGGTGALNSFITPFNAAPYSIVITETTTNYNTHHYVQVVTGVTLAASFRATCFDGNNNASTIPIYYMAFGR